MIRRYRFRMKLHGLAGWAWWLAMLWVGIGAAASGFIFLSSTQPVTASNIDGIPAWLGGPGSANVIVTGGLVAIAAWLVLTIPVLVSGLVRLRAARQPLWVGAWVVGLPLMILTRVWLHNLPERTDLRRKWMRRSSLLRLSCHELARDWRSAARSSRSEQQ